MVLSASQPIVKCEGMDSSISRKILFLQGPPSTFWGELARGFEKNGHRTVKINVCFGDSYFWRRRGAYHFFGRFRAWPRYLENVIRHEGVTDIIYYADRQPYHIEAQKIARKYGIRCYAVEFGYLRPEWLTLERGGMGAYSHFPSDPDLIRSLAKDLPEPEVPTERYAHRFFSEAYGEVCFHLSSEFFRFLYPFYRSDRYYHAFVDYLSWVAQLFREPFQRRRADCEIKTLLESGSPFFVVALQLQSDYQIRANSPYRHIREMLDEVIGSFARKAAAGDHLLIKQHPLDNGYENWDRIVSCLAERYGVADRVRLVCGGNLHALVRSAKGTIVINSTVGLHALKAGCPTKVLGVAVFDVPGLSDQQPLDDFWQAPQAVDMELLDDLVRLLAKSIQLRGSFYNKRGRKVAVAEIVRRIELGLVNEPGAYVEILPRRQRARLLGLPLAASPLGSDDVADGDIDGNLFDLARFSR